MIEQLKKIGERYAKYHYPELDVTVLPFKLQIQEGYIIQLITDTQDLPFISAKHVRMLENGASVKKCMSPYATKDKLGWEYDIVKLKKDKDLYYATHKNNSNYVRKIDKSDVKEELEQDNKLIGIKLTNNNEYILV